MLEPRVRARTIDSGGLWGDPEEVGTQEGKLQTLEWLSMLQESLRKLREENYPNLCLLPACQSSVSSPISQTYPHIKV